MSELSELQKIQLDILCEFTRICDANQLRYYLVEGSMLGAVRHSGFIPWDDDIDVAMPRSDYEVFLKIADGILGKDYSVSTHHNEDHYWMTAILFYKKYKVQLNNASRMITSYPWIDIIPIDGAPNGRFAQVVHYYYFYLHRVMFQISHFSSIVNVNKRRKFYEIFLIKLLQTMNVEGLLNSEKICERLHRVLKKYDFDRSLFVMSYISDYKFRELMPREWYGTGKKYAFEGKNVKGVMEANKYLTQLYGDYTQLPPVESRVGKHNVTMMN